MAARRVAAFVDGFNLYHAVDGVGLHHLKWVNVRALCEHFAPVPQYDLAHVFYFSAFATWRPDAYKRHREYLKALREAGVTPIMGRFKPKDRRCFSCGHNWRDHEEKQTDVNIALGMLRGAFNDLYDRALLISGDSDLVPAVRMVLDEFPHKDVRVITPLERKHSMDLYRAVGGGRSCKRMRRIHLERSLFPRELLGSAGEVVAIRPTKYDPPAGS